MQPGNRTSYLPITERPAELQHIGNFNLQCNGADRQQKQPFVDLPACHICTYSNTLPCMSDRFSPQLSIRNEILLFSEIST